jgi:EAL domain-containing protein (putative c-di-GMP-specific phosphodiesterase class I)
MSDREAGANPRFWYLEGFVDEERRLRRVPILKLPFTIGRQVGLDLTLGSTLASGQHAEILQQGDSLIIRDHASTNGTFLNRERLTGEAPLQEGDILHFATLEFRLGLLGPGQTEALFGSTLAMKSELPELLVDRTRRFRELLDQRAVTSVYQPIVRLVDRKTVAFEVLGRGDLDGFATNTGELFELAAVTGAEAELSRLFRSSGIADCARSASPLRFFFNTHPAELREPGLLEAVEEIHHEFPQVAMTLEIHEAAITDPTTMREIKNRLADLDIQLAYDDFGAGQARLVELAAAPPDYLKFDRALVKEIDRATDARRRLLEGLAKMAIELGIPLIAEGVENAAETEVCESIGFEYGQGYYLGRPITGDALAS